MHDVVDALKQYADRLRRVQIDSREWNVILDTYDAPTTFFYLDPPYLPETRSAGGYVHEMTVADHERLIDRLKTVEGMVLLSGYPNELYESLDWHRTDIETFAYSAFRKGDSNTESKARTECLWRNYMLADEVTQMEFL